MLLLAFVKSLVVEVSSAFFQICVSFSPFFRFCYLFNRDYSFFLHNTFFRIFFFYFTDSNNNLTINLIYHCPLTSCSPSSSCPQQLHLKSFPKQELLKKDILLPCHYRQQNLNLKMVVIIVLRIIHHLQILKWFLDYFYLLITKMKVCYIYLMIFCFFS